MKRSLIHWLGLTGIAALLSYAAAVIFAPFAYPGYNWMAQAVSDLSAEAAPSRQLWNQLAAPYNIAMNWVSAMGYGMFPLADGGKEIASFQEIMHMVVTAAVVLLSIASLVCLIVAGCRDGRNRGIAVWAAVAFGMMLVGSIGTGVAPPEYFGIVERFSVFAAVGFNAVLGWYLFSGLM